MEPDPGVAREVLRQHREAFARYAPAVVPEAEHRIARREPGLVRDGLRPPVEPPAGPALTRDGLPSALRDLVDGWERDHPDERLDPVRLVTFGRGTGTNVGSDATPPDDDETTVVLSFTRTVVSTERIDVTGESLLARRSPGPA